jgi:hypothetical protein
MTQEETELVEKSERSPEEVERILKLGIRLGKLTSEELRVCIGLVAGYLGRDGTLTGDEAAAIQGIVSRTEATK